MEVTQEMPARKTGNEKRQLMQSNKTAKMSHRKRGWLSRVLDNVEANYDRWPKWMESFSRELCTGKGNFDPELGEYGKPRKKAFRGSRA
jgi:hypothetical protein